MRRTAPFVVVGLVVTATLAFFVSPHASSSPDGLNKVAIDEGFDRTAQSHALADAPTAGYAVRGVDDDGLSTGLAAGVDKTRVYGELGEAEREARPLVDCDAPDAEGVQLRAEVAFEPPAEGKIRRTHLGWAADTFIVPMDAPSGWEAAVYDHFHAVVRSICARLQRETAVPERPQASGGSTYSFTVWPGHPHAELAYDTLARARAAADETRETILAWNDANPRPQATHEVTFYLGQSVLQREEGSA